MSIAQMKEALRLARQLGFWDDVVHWETEIRKAEASND